MTSFQDKVAFITGGSSGIGRATALAFARQGAHIQIADINAEGGLATAEEITASGGSAYFSACDVSNADAVQSAIAAAVERWGRIDCAFNNAGREGIFASFLEWDESVFDDTFATNVKGVWLCMKAQLSQMATQGFGTIVNTASVAGLVGARGLSVYAGTKHAVVGLTRSAALEFASLGVRVNAVCPGFIETPMVDRIGESHAELRERLVRNVPMRRMGQPEEVAEAVLWLSSDAASYVTGTTLTMDGGITAA